MNLFYYPGILNIVYVDYFIVAMLNLRIYKQNILAGQIWIAGYF